jgi:hypothetical protein
VRALHRESPRRAPRPTRAPPTLTLDLITREKKKTGEKLLRIVRSGRAPPPAAAAAAALTSPHQPRLPPTALAFLGLVGPLAGGRAPEPAQRERD